MGKMDSEKFKTGMSGEKVPSGALSSDTSGERKMSLKGGVGMGKADGLGMREASHAGKIDGRLGEMKGGSSESTCYDHKRYAHAQDSM